MRGATSRLLTTLFIGILFTCVGCRNSTNADSQDTNGDAVAVKITKPIRKKLKRTTTQPATLHAYHKAEIYAKVSGYLKELKADIGDKVAADQLLGVIDVPEMKIAAQRQSATIKQLTEEEKRVKAEEELAEASLKAAAANQKQAEAELKKVKAQLKADESEFERIEDLVKKKAVEKRLLDEALRRLEASLAAKDAAIAAVDSAKAQWDVANAKLSAAKAEKTVAQEKTIVARKQLEEMKALMDFAEIRAPFAGVVTQRNVDEGDLVRNMQTASDKPRKPLFTIAQVDKIRVQVAIPENDAPLAKVGKKVIVKLRSLPDKTFGKETKIDRIAASLDPSTRTMIAEIDLPNDDHTLLPGMYAEVTIILEDKANALVLPAAAVRHDDKGKAYVYVIQPDQTIRIVNVMTGMDDGKEIEIVSGLDGSESVVGPMIGRLQNGQKVQSGK